MPNTAPDNQVYLEKPLHVAVGVIVDGEGRILIARRPEHVHQGGLWEFPGGKVELGETVNEALRRELAEELALQVQHAKPLIKIGHRYPDRNVLLDVWRIDDFVGKAAGLEGQEVRWVEPRELTEFDFPEANNPIISAALLPDYYGILEGRYEEEVLANLKRMLERGVKLIQLRLKTFVASAIRENLLDSIGAQCLQHGAQLMLNSDLASRCNYGVFNGIHLTSRDLVKHGKRPPHYQWVAASCHNLLDLRHAEAIGVDFAVLAPVLKTRSHPETEPLGWMRFAEMVEQAKLPVYALGGLQLSDLEQARLAGGQGIAGISTFQ